MERPDEAIDNEYIRVGWFMEGTDPDQVILSGFAFNKAHGIILGGVICDLVDNFWEAGYFKVNIRGGLSTGKSIECGVVGGGRNLVHIVHKTDIRGRCCGAGID